MAVEGFKYTRNKFNYLTRLLIATVVMAVGNSVVNAVINNSQYTVHNNIFLTLFLGVLMLVATE